MAGLTTIALRKDTYFRLSQLGKTPESFNTIVERLLAEHEDRKNKELQTQIFDTFKDRKT